MTAVLVGSGIFCGLVLTRSAWAARSSQLALLPFISTSKQQPVVSKSLRDVMAEPRFIRMAALAVGLLAGFLFAGPLGSVVGTVVAWTALRFVEKKRSARVRARIDERLADTASAIAAGLRAGLSLSQSLAHAAQEALPPLDRPLRRLVEGMELGVPLDDSLEDLAVETDSSDVRLLAGVLRLHRRTGGDLPVVLDQVAATLSERQESVREVGALTAQARLSGGILGLLPVGFFVFLWLTSRQEIEAALRSPIGVACILGGLALDGFAFLWIKSLLEVR